MALFAGIVSLRGSGGVPTEDRRGLVEALSRENDPLETHEDGRLFLAKVDFGALADPVFLREPFVATVSGEPFYAPAPGKVHRRGEDLGALAPRLLAGDDAALLDCAGTFAFVIYDPASGRVLVGSDRVGIRPLYLHRNDDHLYFANNLRTLEGIPGIRKRMDARAVTEIVCFGVPLGDRTPYAGIRNLRGGRVVSVDGSRVDERSYYRWRDIPATTLDREAFLDRAHRTLLAAVETRSARDHVAVGYLSGGLDSRVLIAGLRELGKDVHTITFEYPHLMDGVTAREVASALGTRHTGIPVNHAAKGRLLQASVPAAMRYPEPGPAYPRAVFSGDGGSVGLGFVYMDPGIVQAMRDGRIEDAVRRHLGNKRLPRRIMTERAFAMLKDVPARGVTEELALARTRDPAKDFHVYLMDNDQRRHLHYLYEDLDRYRVELLLPFLDGRWLDLIASAPVDWFLGHAFYYDFLKRFPEPTASIPWQAYPGHLPCPLPADGDSRPQWRLTRHERFQAASSVFARCRGPLFRERRFPAEILRRPGLVAAAALHGLKIKNYIHLLSAYDAYQTYYRRSEDVVL
jgi:asparagine synthase (glutamine-hydrolysing)